MQQPDETRPDLRESDALTEADLAAQFASDLPAREALSLLDPGRLMGGTSLPATSQPGSAPASGAPAPSAGAPADPIALPGSLGSLSNKVVGTGPGPQPASTGA